MPKSTTALYCLDTSLPHLSTSKCIDSLKMLLPALSPGPGKNHDLTISLLRARARRLTRSNTRLDPLDLLLCER
ncbi:hypothetical protein ElyMa_003893900 [Elysia marginata]|uniref:Uncharacterized protein n=1 Tax=Elysia marginata TaxID=1093978 RepID=A0AAV4FNE4_9GAST|nr:hypothetical protein ElyMa_003893900 [Elysia marginata]